MRNLLLLLIVVLLSSSDSSAQRFYSIVFDQLPADMQMYARDHSSYAKVPISGVIETPDWVHMSTVVYRGNERYAYSKSVLNYESRNQANFEMSVNIKAEMADYTFEVWACKREDSVLIVTRTDVVAGDFYLISGQSNGAAIASVNWGGNKYCRTIARIPDNDPTNMPGDTSWIQSVWSHPFTGAWGIHLQRLILENHGIPTTVINASLPGAKIAQFVDRNTAFPADPHNLYGLLIHRTNIAKPERIKGFFWYQGEQEAIENIPGYESYFKQLHANWLIDFPTVEKFYIIQTNVIFSPVSPGIRDFQRLSKYNFPKTDHFATLGINLSDDGVHYLSDGYEELGRRIFDFLEPQYYGAEPDPQVRSPDIRKVFYTTPEKNQIAMVFEEGQQMEWPSDSVVKGKDGSNVLISNKDFFFFDGRSDKKASITEGRADGNKVIITLATTVNEESLTYLPIEEVPNVAVLRGPYIRNSRKLGIFSFANVEIKAALASPALTATGVAGAISLQWVGSEGASSYVLQRRKEGDAVFSKIAEAGGDVLTYMDSEVEENTRYWYKIYAANETSESPAVEREVVYSPVLSIEGEQKLSLILSPNPVVSPILKLAFSKEEPGWITIFDSRGIVRYNENIGPVKEYDLSVDYLEKGVFFVTFSNEKGEVVRKMFVR